MMSKSQGIDRLWTFFASTKLTVVLLLVLAGTSIIGTLIQQGQPPVEYVKRYGETGFHLFNILGLFDLYHSWWFQALLLALCLNIVVCAWEKIPLEWRAARKTREPLVLSQLRSYPVKEEISRAEAQNLTGVLSGFSRRSRTFETPDGTLYLAERGRYARLGPHVVHLSLLVIVVGALIGSFLGFRGNINILEGESSTRVYLDGGRTVDLGFEVQCKKFAVEFYPGSQRPKKFASHLVVVDAGRPVVEKTIEVNDPLSYRGLTFYQASYGPAGDPRFTLELVELSTGKRTIQTVGLQDHIPLRNGSSYFSIVDFTPNYRLDMAEAGHKDLGPTALVALYEDGGMKRTFPIFQNYPDFEPGRGGKFTLVLKGYTASERYYTGLQVTKDPGVWVVWTGCALMFIGLLQALLSSHRRIWAFVPQDARGTVLLAGKADRDRLGFEREFAGLVEKLKKR